MQICERLFRETNRRTVLVSSREFRSGPFTPGNGLPCMLDKIQCCQLDLLGHAHADEAISATRVIQ